MRIKHIAGHILFWSVIMLAYAVSDWGYENSFTQAIIYELLFLPVRLVAVYVNWFILIPRLLYHNKLLLYTILLSALILGLAILQRYFTLFWGYPTFFPEWVANAPAPRPWLWYRVVQTIVIIASPVAFSTGIKLFFNWYNQKNKSKQLALEKREAELKYLRSQINPHFLFNTLNNLYGLALENSKKVPKLILQLSDLLSYSLYESSVDKTSIKKEIKLIEDYISLEQERYGARLQINWEIDQRLDLETQIAPLLFMPLVENAFKHGAQETLADTLVSIKLVGQSDDLTFQVKNSLPELHSQENDQQGIGLINLKRRLDLLYPEQHTLQSESSETFYIATLNLTL